jgi:hypothetical protein
MVVKGISCLLLLGLLTISSISFVSAKNISLSYPEEISVGEKFSIKISLVDFEEDTYDLKIEVMDENGKRLSKVLNNDVWRSTYYYVNDIIKPGKEEELKFMVSDYEGYAEITVKIKDSKGDSVTFAGYTIHVIKGTTSNEEIVNTTKETTKIETNTETQTDEEKTTEENKEVETSSSVLTKITSSVINEEVKDNSEVIKLSPKDIKTNESQTSYTKSYAKYGLGLFCVLLLLLFVVRAIRNKRKHGIQ